jgi:hypothetical protein
LFKGKLFVLIMWFIITEVFSAKNAVLIFFHLIVALSASFHKIIFSMLYKVFVLFQKHLRTIFQFVCPVPQRPENFSHVFKLDVLKLDYL